MADRKSKEQMIFRSVPDADCNSAPIYLLPSPLGKIDYYNSSILHAILWPGATVLVRLHSWERNNIKAQPSLFTPLWKGEIMALQRLLSHLINEDGFPPVM